METSITSETILQHTMCKNNEGSYTEADREQIKLEWKQNQLSKSREIDFKYFSSQKMAWTKVTVWKYAMMGLPLFPSIKGKPCCSQKGKTWSKEIREDLTKDGEGAYPLKVIPAWYKSPLWDKEVPKIHQVAGSESLILQASEGDNAKGTWRSLDPGRCSVSPPWSDQGLHHSSDGGHKLVCYTCKMCNDSPTRYEISLQD